MKMEGYSNNFIYVLKKIIRFASIQYQELENSICMILKDKYNTTSSVSEMKDGVLSRCIFLYINKKAISSENELTQERNPSGYSQRQ